MIDFSKYSNKKLRLTKMKDNVFNNEHPNNINEGAIREGDANLKMCKEHRCLFIHPTPDRFFHTSEVKSMEEMEGYDLAHTVNSIYKVEIID